jgi:hypothetical protein
MATRQEVIFVCDVCELDQGATSGIETRRIVLDGVGVEAEVCDGCYEGIAAALSPFVRKGRPIPSRTRLRSLKSVPGSSWRFTSHALIRCGERDLDPSEIVRVIEDPTVTRPGKASDQEIRERNGIKAVVVPDRSVIVTVARKGEEAVDSYVAGQVG